jgi:hypothetical protein
VSSLMTLIHHLVKAPGTTILALDVVFANFHVILYLTGVLVA